MQSHLSFIETLKTLIRHRRLADSRSYSSVQNKFAKAMIYVSMALCVVYLIGLSIPFAMIANESRSTTSVELLCVLLPFILLFDFGMRFLAQQTPSQIVRPYLLLPLSRYACIDAFVFSSLFNWGNLIWLTFVLPYILMSMIFSYGLLTSFLAIVFVIIMVLANSQWYSIARTLVNDSYLWWLLPAGVYALLAMPMYVGSDAGFDQFANFYSYTGELIGLHSPIPLILALVFLALLVSVNRKLQLVFVMRELMRSEKKTTLKKINNYSFLERYGEIGTFLQLEVKLLMRNKNPRKAFFTGIVAVLAISTIIIFTDMYDSSGTTTFWGLYNFILLGANILVRGMGYEGNYIDGLLVHKEKILTLLQAKYVFYSVLLLLPFVLMLPVVISGKWSIYMLFSFMVFTMGFQYLMFFQTAVYSKQAIPLNEKLTSKGGLDGNYIQTVIMAVVFIVPNILVGFLQAFFSSNTAYTILLIIGVVCILTHKIWLRNVYKRIMKRKYINLEGFAASR